MAAESGRRRAGRGLGPFAGGAGGLVRVHDHLHRADGHDQLPVGPDLEHLAGDRRPRAARDRPRPRCPPPAPSVPLSRPVPRAPAPALLPDALLDQPPRLARRVVGSGAGGAERLLHPLACLEQVRAGLLPAYPLGVLLAALELRLARGLRLLLDRETRAEHVDLDLALGERGPRGGQLALPLLHRGEQCVEAAFRVRHARLGVGHDVGRHTQPARDGEAVGAARHALEETVGRA